MDNITLHRGTALAADSPRRAYNTPGSVTSPHGATAGELSSESRHRYRDSRVKIKTPKLFSRSTPKMDGNASIRSKSSSITSFPESPDIRPTGRKLQARNEEVRWSAQSLKSSAASEKESLTDVLAASRDSGVGASRPPLSSQGTVENLGRKSSVTSSIRTEFGTRAIQQCYSIAASAARDRAIEPSWAKYLRSYTKGEFNLSRPPTPPATAAQFTSLPALYPANETERLAVVLECCNFSLGVSGVKRMQKLCVDAMAICDVDMCAVSTFDHDHELFLAEKGYASGQYISRLQSIAAHALMSSETMVILDATKDWRFSGNVFVKGSPKIRFFAAAPMLTPDGDVLGVFSVFSQVPRDNFEFKQRRQLSAFAATVTNLVTGVEEISRMGDKTFMLNHEYMASNIPTNNRSLPQPSRISCHNNLIPPALNIRKTSYEVQLQQLKAADEESGCNRSDRDRFGDANSEPTPPSSSDDSRHRSQLRSTPRKTLRPLPEINSSHRQGSAIKQLAKDFSGFYSQDLEDVFDDRARKMTSSTETPVRNKQSQIASGYRSELYYENRQFSEYDSPATSMKPGLQSYDQPRPESPVIPSPLLDDNETSLSFDTSSGVFTEVHRGGSITQMTMGSFSQTNLGKNEGTIHHHRTSVSTFASCSTEASSISESKLRAGVEIEFATKYWAERFDCDVIYTVSFTPVKEGMTLEELALPGNMNIEYLSSYGQEGPIDLLDFHLDALNRSVPAIYEQHNAGAPGDISSGYMMRLDQSSLSQASCDRGILFCAFRKIRLDGTVPEPVLNEAKNLGQAAAALKNAFMMPSTTGTPKHKEISPASPHTKYDVRNDVVEDAACEISQDGSSPGISAEPSMRTPKPNQKVLNTKHELRLR